MGNRKGEGTRRKEEGRKGERRRKEEDYEQVIT